MRIRAVTLLTALVTVGMLVVGASSAEAKSAPKAAACTGSTKSAAIKQIKLAYDYFLNGAAKPPRTIAQREAYISGMSDPALAALFEKGFGANAAAAATTNIKINSVTCTNKTTASVKADLVISGKVTPGIFPSPGSAVVEGGVWKAGKQTFCDLEALSDSTITQSGPCSVM
jgi:hypothetical protein